MLARNRLSSLILNTGLRRSPRASDHGPGGVEPDRTAHKEKEFSTGFTGFLSGHPEDGRKTSAAARQAKTIVRAGRRLRWVSLENGLNRSRRDERKVAFV